MSRTLGNKVKFTRVSDKKIENPSLYEGFQAFINELTTF